jgi:hypothetical protein
MDERSIDIEYIKVRKEEFETSVHEPWIWEDRAGVLKRAADCLLDRYDTTHKKLFCTEGVYRETIEEIYDLQLPKVYYMLIGLSVENLIKKIILMNKPELETNLEAIKSHDMVKLLKINSIKGFEKYYSLLNTLCKYVKWKGRYTIPLDLRTWLDAYHPDEPRKEVDELYIELKKRLKQDSKLMRIRDDTGINLSQKEYQKTKQEVIRFIHPSERDICIKDISCAIQSAKEISEKLGYPIELIGVILWECLDDEMIRFGLL